ncbi:MAG TPA: hypothetical protein VFQ61_13235, partial [Polyangiaceae bacterium]|nr:hypothetical protein [Polyangiaceae bacterium]
MHLRASLGTGLLVLAWGVSACGGGANKPATTPLNVESAPAATAAPQPDLSPVAQPPDLVAVARVARAQSFVETLASWAGIPTSLLNTLPAEVQALSGVIDWSAPVEAAAVLDRHSKRKSAAPEGVFSVGITSLAKALDLAREHGAKPAEVSPSIYRLDFDEEFSCALAPALGPSRLRLVCGNGWTAVEDLLPYATRGLPTQPLAQQDVYLALNAAPLQARYGEEIGSIRLLTGLLLRQIQSDNPRLDRALTDSAYAIADELKALALDAQRFELTGHLDTTKNNLSLGYALQFAGEQSFFVQINKDLAARARPAPEVWFSLPKTA